MMRILFVYNSKFEKVLKNSRLRFVEKHYFLCVWYFVLVSTCVLPKFISFSSISTIQEIYSHQEDNSHCFPCLLRMEAKLFARCLLLVIFCSLHVTFCSLLVTFCSLLVTFCSLLVTFCSLLVTFCL